MVLFRAVCVGNPRKFRNSFFVKNCYLNLNFFQVLQRTHLKNEKQVSRKRPKPAKNCLTQQETEGQKINNNNNSKATTRNIFYFFI